MNTKVFLYPVAYDSFGVKGMCTRIETPDLVITIDPGVSIEDDYFPLPEAARVKLLEEYQEAVLHSCLRSTIIVITHYHLDHFLFTREPKVYSGKVLFIKKLEDLPNKQIETAQRFLKTIEGLPKEIIWADGRRFRFKKTEIGFSFPVWHGPIEADPGKVIMVYVKRGKDTVLVSSDVAGPIDRKVIEVISTIKPKELVIDGYPSFLKASPSTEMEFFKSIINICQIMYLSNLKRLILDHHFARDYRYPALFRILYDKAKELRKDFGTAAEVSGKISVVLEGLKNYGPTRWHHWQPIDAQSARGELEKAVANGFLEKDWLSAFERWVVPSKAISRG